MMKQRFGGMFGGLLSIALGVILIVGGSLTGSGGGAGTPPPTCQGEVIGGGVPCPTGTITISESTVSASAKRVSGIRTNATPPASWTVLLTSTNCTAPNGSPVSQTLTVPTGGSATSDPLFVYTDPGHGTSCSYQLMVTPQVGYTSKFSPAPPITIPFTANRATGNTATVQLINTAVTPVTPTTSASTSRPRTSSAPASTSASRSASASASASDQASTSAAAAPIAATGPRTPASWTLVLGIGLCLLGAVLLFAGRPERWRGRRAQ